MTPEAPDLSTHANPLATPSQLSTTSSRLDGIPADLEAALRFHGAQLTQAAGILLHLPQELIAQAVVIFYRFYAGVEGGSFRVNAVKNVSAASLYLIAKPSFHPLTPRSLLNVYAYLTSSGSPLNPTTSGYGKPDDQAYYLSESDYIAQRHMLFQLESIILRTISYTTSFVAPHKLALTYLQTLGILPSKVLARRTIEYLNTALLSPQLLYVTHQPNSLAVAAIYLAAREAQVPLPRAEWWEVFDVDREELGFLIVGMLSVEGYVAGDKERWKERGRGMWTVEDVEEELRVRENGG